MLPVIALVGRPNVGKSTLFNCLTRTRDAIVADLPGVTRDRQYGHAKFNDMKFIVIDTGGLSGEEEGIDDLMAQQSRQAIQEADYVLFMVDARDGLTGQDEIIARFLRTQKKTIHLVINKIDGLEADIVIGDFYSLGLGQPLTIAASHNRGTKILLEHIFNDIPLSTEEDEDDETGIKLAIVGRPNAGKSTLVNRMLGEERVVVFDQPGTTRDSIYLPLERRGQEYTLIDTAGVRRRTKIDEHVEKFSVVKTLQSIEEANVVILVLDATREIAEQDLRLIDFVLTSGRALVLAINKWDNLDGGQRDYIKRELERRLPFVKFVEKICISALHGTAVGDLFPAVNRAYASATKKVATSMLNKILETAVDAHQPPLVHGHRIKLRYAHIGGHNPPLVVIHGNQLEHLPGAYKRYLIATFQKTLKLVGTPIRLEFKVSENPFKDKKNTLTPRQEYKRKRMKKMFKK